MLSHALQTTSYKPDYLSSLPTRELQRILRETPTLPLDALLNHGGTRIDYSERRIWRDSFWKGTFAPDNLLGWEERVASSKERAYGRFTGGRFWKRLDEKDGDALRGFVVNYNVRLLPGKPVVRAVKYPDQKRSFIAQGDDVLLLTYRNAPYHFVYDLIKVVDPNNIVGVMHLGKFPSGLEFATWVGARNNYPFENMAVPDHDAIFGNNSLRTPTSDGVLGQWRAYRVWVKNPDESLHNQFNVPTFKVRFENFNGSLTARMQFTSALTIRQTVGMEDGLLRMASTAGHHHEVKQIDENTLLGRKVRSVNGVSSVISRYVLSRVE